MNKLLEAAFDNTVRLAAHICDASIAWLIVFDSDQSNLIACIGSEINDFSEINHIVAYIKQNKEGIVIADLSQDKGHSAHLLAAQLPGIRFFAGMPLVWDEYSHVGMLCVLDVEPRELLPFQLDALKLLAKQSIAILAMRTSLMSVEHEKQKYAALLQISGDGVHIFDRQGNVIEINEKFCEMLGYKRQELLSMNVADWDAGFSPDSLKDKVQQTFNAPDIFETKHRRKDGTIIDVEISAQPVWIDNQLYLWNASRDITQRKLAEVEHAKLLRIIEESTDFIGTADTEGCVKYLNKAARRMVGITEDFDVTEIKIKNMHPDHGTKIVLEQGIPSAIMHDHWLGENSVMNISGFEIPVSQVILVHRDKHGKPQLFSTIMRDISVSKEHEKSLQEAKEIAERANRAKTVFLTNISHELRTPLNAILGFSQLLRIDVELNESCKQHVIKIERSGRLLLDLVNDLIDLGRIESGKLQFNVEMIAIDPLIKDILKIFQSMAEEKGIALIYQNDLSDIATVRADSARLRQVLINLLSNAIKYNRPYGNITLTCERRTDNIRISVIDTGIGIPFHLQQRIFNSFDRLGREGGKIEGVGIGLSICKNITEAMAGIIGFNSIDGKGSTFWIEFPANQPVNNIMSQRDASLSQGSSKPMLNTELRLLLVEDNEINQLLACAILEKIGYAVDVVENGAKAVEAIQNKAYDLVLMDCLMPVMDGYEATRIIRQNEVGCGKHIPIIAMTANAMANDREACLSAGMDDYLAKPIDFTQLENTLNRWLKNH